LNGVTVTIRSRVDGALQQVLFHEGQDIAMGAPFAVIDPRTYEAALEQAEARLQQDQAALANTQLIFQRDAKLGRDAFVSQQTVDNEHSAVAQLEAQVAQDRAAIETARTELSYTQITAPIDGRAGLRLVDEGNIVHAADPTGLVVLNQIHPIAVISTLPQSEVATIRAALAAGPVAARAVSREDGTMLDTGSVEIIDNEIDPKSGTLRVKSTFANREDRLWPGQFVDVRLRVTTLTGVVTVPADAVQRGPDGPFVYTVGADGRVAATPVTPGQIAEGIAVIKAGIAEGQEVVVQGQYRLAPGVTVRGKAQGG
jgi:multidrug efflux system membrane fusion protein